MLFVAFNVVCCVVCWMFYVEFQCCDICRDTGQSTHDDANYSTILMRFSSQFYEKNSRWHWFRLPSLLIKSWKKPSWFSEVIYLGPSLDRTWGLGQNLVPQWKTWKELVENCQHRPLCSSCCYYQFLVQWVKDDTIGTYGLSKSSSNFQLSTSIHKKN